MAGAAREMSLSGFAAWCEAQGRSIDDVDLTPAWKVITVLLSAATKKNFESATAPDGTPWPALQHPRPEGYGGTSDKPLNDFGLLKASASARGESHIEEVDSLSLVYGSALIYAAIHQFGGRIVPKGHPCLSIPMTREAARWKSPRDFPRVLFPLPRAGAPPLLCEADIESGEVIPQYALVPSVEIQARPFLGLNDELVRQIEQVLIEVAVKQFRAA